MPTTASRLDLDLADAVVVRGVVERGAGIEGPVQLDSRVFRQATAAFGQQTVDDGGLRAEGAQRLGDSLLDFDPREKRAVGAQPRIGPRHQRVVR